MEPKPGKRSTEFYVTLGIQLVGVLFLLGVFDPSQKEALELAIPQGAELYANAAALAGMVAAAFGYQISRGMAKKNGK